MKRRWLYVWMFAVPALMVAALIALMLMGGAALAVWWVVLDRQPWPAFYETALGVFFLVQCFGLWLGFLVKAWRLGREEESSKSFNKWHLACAVLVSLGLFGMALMRQWSMEHRLMGQMSGVVFAKAFP